MQCNVSAPTLDADIIRVFWCVFGLQFSPCDLRFWCSYIIIIQMGSHSLESQPGYFMVGFLGNDGSVCVCVSLLCAHPSLACCCDKAGKHWLIQKTDLAPGWWWSLHSLSLHAPDSWDLFNLAPSNKWWVRYMSVLGALLSLCYRWCLNMKCCSSEGPLTLTGPTLLHLSL